MAWATIANVDAVVGLTVTDQTIARATSTLETITGLIEAVARPDITDRDRHFLKLMTCYQVAFMADNPDIFTRADVVSASQDGESVTFRNVDSHLFAPLARKSYRRLSWRSVRLLSPLGGSGNATPNSTDINSETFDNALPWSPV